MAFRVLIVCTGNTCRSPMAEGLLTKRAREEIDSRVEVTSAGTAGFDGLPASDYAQRVAAENGIDLGRFRSSALDRGRIERADLILVMAPSHREVVVREVRSAADRTFLIKEFGGAAPGTGDSVPDPIGGSIDVYREAYRQIQAAIEGALPRLRRLAMGPDQSSRRSR